MPSGVNAAKAISVATRPSFLDVPSASETRRSAWPSMPSGPSGSPIGMIWSQAPAIVLTSASWRVVPGSVGAVALPPRATPVRASRRASCQLTVRNASSRSGFAITMAAPSALSPRTTASGSIGVVTSACVARSAISSSPCLAPSRPSRAVARTRCDPVGDHLGDSDTEPSVSKTGGQAATVPGEDLDGGRRVDWDTHAIAPPAARWRTGPNRCARGVGSREPSWWARRRGRRRGRRRAGSRRPEPRPRPRPGPGSSCRGAGRGR